MSCREKALVGGISGAVAVDGMRGVNTLDNELDEVRIVTGELEGAEALAGVKIFQHVKILY